MHIHGNSRAAAPIVFCIKKANSSCSRGGVLGTAIFHHSNWFSDSIFRNCIILEELYVPRKEIDGIEQEVQQPTHILHLWELLASSCLPVACHQTSAKAGEVVDL